MFNWQQLSQTRDLKEYFDTDFEGFKARIEHHIHQLQKIDPAELDKLAILRVLEVTNGCLQWAYRRQDEECLSIEQTRECMKTVIGFIQDRKIVFPNGDVINFSESIETLIAEGRQLYQEAFKKNMADKEREYYAYSAAQFLVYGRHRIEVAFQVVKQEFEPLFTAYYIERGRRYIAPYLEGLP